MERAKDKCEFCKGPAEQVHHVIYVINEQDIANYDHLVAVCGSCHKLAHGIRDKKLPSPLDIDVENPQDILLTFFDVNGQIMGTSFVLRINPLDLYFLNEFIHYRPHENGGEKLFDEKLRKEFAKRGAICSGIDYLNFIDSPIEKITYKVTRESIIKNPSPKK